MTPIGDEPAGLWETLRDMAALELVTLLVKLRASEAVTEPWTFCHPRRSAHKRARIRELHTIVAQLNRAAELTKRQGLNR